MYFLSHGYDFILLILLWFWHECTFTPCLSRVKDILAQVICCILTKENIDPSHYLWPNYLHYSSVLTYILFFVPPPPHFLFFLFFSQFAFASLFISPSHPFLCSHPSFPPSFILPRHPLHVLMGVLLTPLSSTSSSLINQPTLPSKPPSMTPLLPPAPLHDPPPPSLSGGKNKNHHSSYLPPFWIDLSISTSAPLRLFYLSTCLTLLVALLSL